VATDDQQKPGAFSSAFPYITEWVARGGWVEIGYTERYIGAFVRALDEGGVVYEGRTEYESLDEAVEDLESGIQAWTSENLRRD
jgi:hypothetical protein